MASYDMSSKELSQNPLTSLARLIYTSCLYRRGSCKRDDNLKSDVVIWEGFAANTVPWRFDLLNNVSIKQVSVGVGHYVFLTKDDRVYGCGQNDCGQLGIGDNVPSVQQPVEISQLSGLSIKRVECGYMQSAAIAKSGELWMWGSNKDGQCGCGDYENVFVPNRVIFPRSGSCNCEDGTGCSCLHVTSVSCGKKHSLSLTRGGVLWSWGSGIQLGLGDIVRTCRPLRITHLGDRRVLLVSCGESYSCAIVAKVERSESESLNTSYRDSPVTCSQCKGSMFKVDDINDVCVVTHESHCMSDVSLSSATPISPRPIDNDVGLKNTGTESMETPATVSAPEKSHSEGGNFPSKGNETLSLGGMQQTVIKYATDLRSFFDWSLSSKPQAESRTEAVENRENEARVKESIKNNISGILSDESDKAGECNSSLTSNEADSTICQSNAFEERNLLHSQQDSEISSNIGSNSHNNDISNIDPVFRAAQSEMVSDPNDESINADDSFTDEKSSDLIDDIEAALSERSANTVVEERAIMAADRSDLDLSDSTDGIDPINMANNFENLSENADGILATIDTGENSNLDKVQELEYHPPEVDLDVDRSSVKTEETLLFDPLRHSGDGSETSVSSLSNEIAENVSSHTDKVPPEENCKNDELSGHNHRLINADSSSAVQTETQTCFKPSASGFSYREWSMTILDEEEARIFLARQFDDLAERKTTISIKDVCGKDGKLSHHANVSSSKKSPVFRQLTPQKNSIEMKKGNLKIDKTVSVQNPQMSETNFDADVESKFVSSSEFFISDEVSLDETNACQGQRPRSLAFRRGHLSSQKKATEKVIQSTKEPESHPFKTEVWAWGMNSHAQLGLGHCQDVNLPALVKTLNNRNVTHVATGAQHTLALTADNQVYSWGSNEYGQLGQSEMNETPTKVKTLFPCCVTQSLLESPVWGIAAGASHSLFLLDVTGFQPEVYYAGKQPSDDIYSSVVKTFQPQKLHFLKQHGWVRNVLSRGDNCAALVSIDNSGFLATHYEFLSSERRFYSRLRKAVSHFLLPLRKTEFYVAGEESLIEYRMSSHAVVSAFVQASAQASKQCQEVTALLQQNDDILDSTLFEDSNVYFDKIAKYSSCLSDFIALDGIGVMVRYSHHFMEKTKSIVADILENVSRHVELSNLEALKKIFQLPLHHISDYLKFAKKMALHYQETGEKHGRLMKFVERVDTLLYNSAQELSQAQKTRSFWETCNPKLVETLRKCGRRLIRDSKSHPLSLYQSLRLSTHTFYLFNDVFIHHQPNSIRIYPLETVWVQASSESAYQNAIEMVTPEDALILTTSSAANKAEWLSVLNRAINKALSKSTPTVDHVTPPLVRRGSYAFQRLPEMKDAKYSGTWLDGTMHGQGELSWPDGRRYRGKFKRGQQHGSGEFVTPYNDGMEIYSGMWKNGCYHGYGTLKYSNGDTYDGYFKKGLRFGHGVYTHGSCMSNMGNVYIGEWAGDCRQGYGVMDDMAKGEKYMGMWEDNRRHGNGIVVTLDGMYFEGQFINNKLTGFGLMLTDDNSYYEGDFNGITQLYGKGKLTLPNGDYIEGQFSGSWNDGLKINGTFSKTAMISSASSALSNNIQSEYYGKLSVPADKKWTDIFNHCCGMLGYRGNQQSDTDRAWEMVAVIMSASSLLQHRSDSKRSEQWRRSSSRIEGLEKIPPHNLGTLTPDHYTMIRDYLSKAFMTSSHPLGKMMTSLVDVFRAAYIGVGAHPRLLHHASHEVKSFVRRMYEIVRILFPDLPQNGGPVSLTPEKAHDANETTMNSLNALDSPDTELDNSNQVVTAAGLIHPILLPCIYPALFDLYALFNDKQDERYWERVVKLNRQGDIALMAYLGIDEKFWLFTRSFFQDNTQISSVKDRCYLSAIDTLQQISTAFSPSEKLTILEQTFTEITKAVSESLGETYIWCMDELFPIFQFVVVRSKVHHLGAEIHLIDDLMEPHLQYGVLGIMFTTLKACYFQIQTEKIPSH